VAELVDRFHVLHEREHTFRRHGGTIEMYRLNLTAVGATRTAELRRYEKQAAASEARPRDKRPVFFDELHGSVMTDVYWRDDLSAGMQLRGPAIIEQLDSTTVIPPDVPAEVDEWRNIRMYIGGGARS
jgi:N-methylhydantoinase A